MQNGAISCTIRRGGRGRVQLWKSAFGAEGQVKSRGRSHWRQAVTSSTPSRRPDRCRGGTGPGRFPPFDDRRSTPQRRRLSVKALTTRHWSDWAGTLAFTAIAVGIWRQAPEFGGLILPGLIQELLIAISFLVRGRSRTRKLIANSFLV